jgi:hypothetical protein
VTKESQPLNRKLKKLVADQALDMMVLKELLGKNPKAQSTPHCHDRRYLPLWALFSPSLPAHRFSRDWGLLKRDKQRLCGHPDDQQESHSSHCEHSR